MTVRCIVWLKFDFRWQLLKELKLLVDKILNHNSVKICETAALSLLHALSVAVNDNTHDSDDTVTHFKISLNLSDT